MKFLIINTDYPDFLEWFYSRNPGLEKQPYDEQMRARNESLFGVADFYSDNLRKLGHEAWDVHANNGFLQAAWAREHGAMAKDNALTRLRLRECLKKLRRTAARTPLRLLKPFFRPVLQSLDSQQNWFYEILAAQIKYYRPDVLLNQVMNGISVSFLKEVKQYTRFLVGQHAATKLPESEDWGCYDLVVSSFPPTIDWFRQRGINCALNRLAFEPRILSYLKDSHQKDIPISFIGSFHAVHKSRVEWLEKIAARFSELKLWGPSVDQLKNSPALQKHYSGQAWGLEMYRILQGSRITLNHHGDVPPYANNCRLYEATGVGTLLITDWKPNLHEMYEPGKEVIAYRTPEECTDLIRHYLENDRERQEVSRAGQEKTLRDHTYFQRMQELAEIIQKQL
ncbi:MAG: glycosyltransferase [Bacillota bacterium]